MSRRPSLAPRLRRVAALALAVGMAACGGGGLSLSEYAKRVETAVATMNERVDAATVEYDSNPPTAAGLRALMDKRSEARAAFVEVLSDLDPPPLAEELHFTALSVVSELRDAEGALAARAGAATTDDVDALWNSEEATQLAAIDARAVAVCDAAQAAFDQTAERAVFDDSSWMPPELKEVVDVAFRCTYEERTGSGR